VLTTFTFFDDNDDGDMMMIIPDLQFCVLCQTPLTVIYFHWKAWVIQGKRTV